MDGAVSGSAAGHDRQGRFTAGHSEYAAKRRRIADRLAELSLEYNASSPARQTLLLIACTHLDEAERTRNAEKRVRATNAAARILRSIPRKPEPEPAPPPLLEDLLNGG